MSLFENIKKRLSNTFSKKEMKYEFHKWKTQLIITDLLISFIVVILLVVFRPDLLMISVYLLLYPYLFLTARKTAFYHLIISSLVALIWILIANNEYGYNHEMFTFLGLNSFPLFAWASGLFAAYLLYSHFEHKIKSVSFIKKIILFVAIYWPILIALETLAFHVFNIRNIATGMYVGLPICDCIHAPLWMQISYFAMGPIYFVICELMGLENPHHIKQTIEITKSKKT